MGHKVVGCAAGLLDVDFVVFGGRGAGQEQWKIGNRDFNCIFGVDFKKTDDFLKSTQILEMATFS